MTRVFVQGHTTSVTILLDDLNGVECAMATPSAENLDSSKPLAASDVIKCVGWKRFIGQDGKMEQKKVTGREMDKAYVKGASLACDERVRKILAHTQDLEDT